MRTGERPTVAGQQQPQKKSNRALQLLGVLVLCLLLYVYALSHNSSPSYTLATTPQSAAPASTTQAQSVRPTIPPPKFRIYRSKNDSGTSLVVPVHTTDEQLKSLLWFLRKNVRSREFKSIGVKEEKDGIFSIYRGERCANEEFIDRIGPCGYGEHYDASYQWGIDGDYNKDGGSIRINGDDTVVFDYKDGWQAGPAPQAKLDGQAQEIGAQAKAGEQARELFAQRLQQRLTSMGYDINVWSDDHIDGPGFLTLDSEMFKDTTARVQFVNSILPTWKKDLCKAGFRQVNLRRGGAFEISGQRYSLGCKY